MDQLYARFRQVSKIANPHRISLANDDYHWGLVYDSPIRQFTPLFLSHIRPEKTICVALDRKNRHIGFGARHYLIGYNLRTCVRSLESQMLSGLFLPLALERRQN